MHGAQANFAHPLRNVGEFGIQHGMRVADFGAGSGAYALAIAEVLQESGAIYAIDVQKELLRRIKNEATRRGYTNVEIIRADLEMVGASKLAEHTLDIVLISNLLFQLSDKKPPLTEAKRILKPRGKLVVIDWSEQFSYENSTGRIGPSRDRVVEKSSVVSLAAESGFELVKEFVAGAHHYGLIFRPFGIASASV